MNDKELADKVVALGIGLSQIAGGMPLYSIDHGSIWLRANEFLRRWGVAGALMEKVKRTDARYPIENNGSWNVHAYNGPNKYGDSWKQECLPRAIIEACVEALDSICQGLNRG